MPQKHCSTVILAVQMCMEIQTAESAHFSHLRHIAEYHNIAGKIVCWKSYTVVWFMGLPSQQKIPQLHVVFRASGCCLDTASSGNWHPQAGLWVWCQLEKQESVQTKSFWSHLRTNAKERGKKNKSVSRCHSTGLCAGAADRSRAMGLTVRPAQRCL